MVVPAVVTVTRAVLRELEELGEAESALGASALALARELDAKTSATSKSMCAKELRETLAVLRAASKAGEGDRMSEFEERLAARKGSVR